MAGPFQAALFGSLDSLVLHVSLFDLFVFMLVPLCFIYFSNILYFMSGKIKSLLRSLSSYTVDP